MFRSQLVSKRTGRGFGLGCLKKSSSEKIKWEVNHDLPSPVILMDRAARRPRKRRVDKTSGREQKNPKGKKKEKGMGKYFLTSSNRILTRTRRNRKNSSSGKVTKRSPKGSERIT